MSTNRRLQILGLIVLILLGCYAYSIYKKKHEGPTPIPTPSVTVSVGGPTI